MRVPSGEIHWLVGSNTAPARLVCPTWAVPNGSKLQPPTHAEATPTMVAKATMEATIAVRPLRPVNRGRRMPV